MIHVDFLAIKADEKVKAEVMLKIIGESPVEKLGLGQIQVVKDFVEVEALPQDLPHDITIDISTIQTANDAIFVKDLHISDKVKILEEPDQVLVTVVSMSEEEEAEVSSAETTTPSDGTSPASSEPASNS